MMTLSLQERNVAILALHPGLGTRLVPTHATCLNDMVGLGHMA